jgi:hypothetical protein
VRGFGLGGYIEEARSPSWIRFMSLRRSSVDCAQNYYDSITIFTLHYVGDSIADMMVNRGSISIVGKTIDQSGLPAPNWLQLGKDVMFRPSSGFFVIFNYPMNEAVLLNPYFCFAPI